MWQSIALGLIGVGALLLIGWSVPAFFLNSGVSLLVRIAVGAIGAGVLMLIGKALKERWGERITRG